MGQTCQLRVELCQMLTRLYLHNFRCFVNFEYRPARRQLLFGGNGTGKSSLFDAILLLRQFAVRGDPLQDSYILSQATRWLKESQQLIELEAALAEGGYVYRLVLEPWGDPPRARVASETVHFDRKPIFEFVTGEVHLYDDRFEHKVTYDFDWHRSALATIIPRKDNQILTRFKSWLSNLFCFRMNPWAMQTRTDAEQAFPTVDLSNYAAWYRHLVQADPKHNADLLDSLRRALDGFSFLQLELAGENIRVLTAEFTNGARFFFHELSDGQRCLICLYTILHFLLAKGATVLLDEPDNFVALREIQPWLMAATDISEEANAQLLLISHHPEILNQWAPGGGVQFVREGGGPVRVMEFRGDPANPLTPSEMVARGWEHE